ncbi:helix-turn-helix transcriptional regulator [Kocuria sp.]|jgi:AraC-like DNA-binding protein|uniref:helix-turn-helix transcriptional regulator n=1 Tax=Kocuria sp. TaxID=1871328 RepID=UPI0028120E9F|nr:helix-turn-helix transcriptional regulator [Kocuria sp.]HST73370.1 helix-turn-helix transcriptional regulator [Kocuria rosea]
MGAVQRDVFVTADAGAAADALRWVVKRAEVQASTAPHFELTASWTLVGPLMCRQSQLGPSSSLQVGIDPPEALSIAQVSRGRMTIGTGRDRPRADDGPFLLPQEPFTATLEAAHLTTTALERSWVEDHAAELLQRDDFRLRFHDRTPRTGAAAEHWRDTVRHLQDDVLDNEEAMSIPLIRVEAYRRIATALLWTFPGTFHDVDAPVDQAPVLPGPVRRAVAFIDEHRELPLGPGEIAAAARLSPGRLERAFREHTGTTPLAYLRTARLDGAHQELMDADPALGATVAAIAHRWGFTDLDRFAAAYRHHYGRSPTSTLHS